jgi:hypothetical protein
MDNDGAHGDANPTGDDLGNRSAPVKLPRTSGADERTTSNDAPHVVYDPLPSSRAETARQQRALRRAYRRRKKAPSWVKKIPWILFPRYGFMRWHDPNYEEHFEHWKEEQRRNYDREPQ